MASEDGSHPPGKTTAVPGPWGQKLSLGPLHHAQQQYLKLTAKILYGKEGRKIL
jgi:hypothetical protein